jgi:NAD+ synthase
MSALSSEFNGIEIAKFISSWINDYADAANIDSFVVGVSGGVDSAVTATLCLMTGRPFIRRRQRWHDLGRFVNY